MEIPVYGLAGLDDVEELDGIFKKIKKAVQTTKSAEPRKAKTTGRAFKKFAEKIKNSKLKALTVQRHKNTLRGIEGIYNVAAAKIAAGTATDKTKADFKKARVLLTLEETDYDAFRLASIYMPYVTDIDDVSGAYYFPSQELAEVAAAGEEELIEYANSPYANELGKIKLFKKIGKAIKKAAKTVTKAVKTVAKATANTAKAAVKSTVNAVKATANLTKAGIQAATGQKSKAKETLKKAASQAKSAVVNPIKQAAKDTKSLVKDTIVEPTKTFVIDPVKNTVKIAGKVFKVIFIKINPITVLIRNSLRGLVALNFRGMASRLFLGTFTKKQAEDAGYTTEQWEKAKTAYKRIVKLYKKMGGKAEKIEKAIKNGSQRKAFMGAKGSYKIDLPSEDSNAEVTELGDPATVATMVSACIGILTTIFGWIAGIVSKKKQEQEAKEQQRKEEEERKKNAELYEVDANGNLILDQYGRPIPKGQIDADRMAAAAMSAEQENKKKKTLKTALIIGGVGLAALMLFKGSKGKKRR